MTPSVVCDLPMQTLTMKSIPRVSACICLQLSSDIGEQEQIDKVAIKTRKLNCILI